jgi:hypothetical protein
MAGGRRRAGRGGQDCFVSSRPIYSNDTHFVKGQNANYSGAGPVRPETEPGGLRGAAPFPLTLALCPG